MAPSKSYVMPRVTAQLQLPKLPFYTYLPGNTVKPYKKQPHVLSSTSLAVPFSYHAQVLCKSFFTMDCSSGSVFTSPIY